MATPPAALTSTPLALQAQAPETQEGTIALLHDLAHRRPRDPVRIQERVLSELQAAPEVAGKAFYAIKYGGDKPTIVSGLSIRAAEALGRAWGNCVATVFQSSETGDTIEYTGRFIDLETLGCFARPVKMSKTVEKRNGSKYKLTGDRLAQASQSCASKALRNAILAGLPEGLKSAYRREADRIVAHGETQADRAQPKENRKQAFLARMASVVQTMQTDWGFDMPACEAWLKKPFDEWTVQSAVMLKGLSTSFADGDQNPEDVMADLAPRKTEGQARASESVRAAAERLGPRSEKEGERCEWCGLEITPMTRSTSKKGETICPGCAATELSSTPPEPDPDPAGELPPVDPSLMAGRKSPLDRLRRSGRETF